MAYAIAAYAIVIGVLVAYGISLEAQRRALVRRIGAGRSERSDG